MLLVLTLETLSHVVVEMALEMKVRISQIGLDEFVLKVSHIVIVVVYYGSNVKYAIFLLSMFLNFS